MAVPHYGFEVPSRLSDAKAQEFIGNKVNELRRLVEVCREQRDAARNDAMQAVQAEMAELRSKQGWLPRLKPLDWHENRMERCSVAQTIIGTYIISGRELFFQPTGLSVEQHIGDFDSIQECKDWAWKCYCEKIGKAFT